MTELRYQIVTEDLEDMEEALDAAGADGWQLVSGPTQIHDSDGATDQWVCTLVKGPRDERVVHAYLSDLRGLAAREAREAERVRVSLPVGEA